MLMAMHWSARSKVLMEIVTQSVQALFKLASQVGLHKIEINAFGPTELCSSSQSELQSEIIRGAKDFKPQIHMLADYQNFPWNIRLLEPNLFVTAIKLFSTNIFRSDLFYMIDKCRQKNPINFCVWRSHGSRC